MEMALSDDQTARNGSQAMRGEGKVIEVQGVIDDNSSAISMEIALSDDQTTARNGSQAMIGERKVTQVQGEGEEENSVSPMKEDLEDWCSVDEHSLFSPQPSTEPPMPLSKNSRVDYLDIGTTASLSAEKTSAASETMPHLIEEPDTKLIHPMNPNPRELLNYTPGSFVGGNDFPERAQAKTQILPAKNLLVVGLRGSGKTALIKRIYQAMRIEPVKVHGAHHPASDERSGFHFLDEYSMCKGNVSVFDTRGYTDPFDLEGLIEGTTDLRKWRPKDDGNVPRDRQNDLRLSYSKRMAEIFDPRLKLRRPVNGVIMVVNVVDFMAKKKPHEMRMVSNLYCNSYFKIGRNRPLVVLTHLDELQPVERFKAILAVREHLQVKDMKDIFCLSGSKSRSKDIFVNDDVMEPLVLALDRAYGVIIHKDHNGIRDFFSGCVVGFFVGFKVLPIFL